MKKFTVKIRLFESNGCVTNATFEIFAKSAFSAKHRVIGFFAEETRKDGDGFEILEVSEG